MSLRQQLLDLSTRDDEVKEFDGIFVRFKPMTVGQRSTLIKKAGYGSEHTDLGKVQAYCLIFCAFEPDTNRAIFSLDDLPLIESAQVGSTLDRMSQEAVSFLNIEADPESKKKPS